MALSFRVVEVGPRGANISSLHCLHCVSRVLVKVMPSFRQSCIASEIQGRNVTFVRDVISDVSCERRSAKTYPAEEITRNYL